MRRLNLSILVSLVLLNILVSSANITWPAQADPLVASNITWHTFFGSGKNDRANAVIATPENRLLVVGTSQETWGEPLNPHAGGNDLFVAEFSQGGKLIWNTFLGGKGIDEGTGIALDSDGRIYIIGNSDSDWGKPLKAYNGQRDVFVAQLSMTGLYKWHTFLGAKGDDTANELTIDPNDQLYVVGTSDAEWGENPINKHVGENDAFVTKLDNNGAFKWVTFLGSKGVDSGEAIGLDNQQQLYIAGSSSETWGDKPLNKHSGNRDAYLAQLTTNGKLLWHTFVGTDKGSDNIKALTVDEDGQLYVAGYSWDSWGKPVRPFAGKGYFDAFVAKFTPDGDLRWHTFLGSPSQEANADAAYSIALDKLGRLYVAGDSREPWGTPLDSFAGQRDVFVVQFDRSNGNLNWQSFGGGSDYDYNTGLTTDLNGKIFVVGYSQAAWGQPLVSHAGGDDAFLVALPPCLPKCAVTGTTEPAQNQPTKPAENQTPSSEPTQPSIATQTSTPSPTQPPTPISTPTSTTVPTQSQPAEPTLSTENQPTAKPAEPTLSTESQPTAEPPKTAEPTQSVEPTKAIEDSPTRQATSSGEQDKTLPIGNITPGSLDLTALPKIGPKKGANTRIALADLGYDDVELTSPYSVAEYTFKMPTGWKIKQSSQLRLNVSYLYNQLDTAGKNQPKQFGNIIVSIDGQVQLVSPIQEATSNDNRLRIPVSADLLNDPEKKTHTLTIALDTSSNCNQPHTSRLTIDAAGTLLSLDYNEDPLQVDLARYPLPFDEQVFTTTQILFVLPTVPTQAELSSAIAIAARLSQMKPNDPTHSINLNSVTDQQLLSDLSKGKPPTAHLVLIGTPSRNQMIAQLSLWNVLPTPLRERRLTLNVEGPATVKPGENVIYNLSVFNTTTEAIPSLLLVDNLPASAQMMNCNPLCIAGTSGREVNWFIQSLAAGEKREFAIQVSLPESLNGAPIFENTFMLLSESSEPLNVNTLQSRVSLTSTERTPISSTSAAGKNFFAQKGWVSTESDGVVQGFTSPWNARQAILVITGLSDEGIAKAGYAMGLRSHIPGLAGSTALINQIQQFSLLTATNAPRAIEASLADLGYSDQLLQGLASNFTYQFEMPTGWRMSEDNYLDLQFSHSQLLNFEHSSMQVFFNEKPLAEMVLEKNTALTGSLRVNLPPTRGNGRKNKIVVQGNLEGLDKCAPSKKIWLTISGKSRLHLNFVIDEVSSPGLEMFPRFFNQPKLSEVAFILPERPSPEEWQQTLQIAKIIGQSSNNLNFLPKLWLGNGWQKEAITNSHLIAIGRPSRNSLLQQLQVNQNLPQPFVVGTDSLEQRLDNVVTRLLPGNSLGILELTRSPWNRNANLLAVTGTTDEGVVWAGRMLTRQTNKLNTGDLAFINGNDVTMIDSRELTRQGVFRSVNNTITGTAEVLNLAESPGNSSLGLTASSDLSPRPIWLIPFIGATAIMVVAILALAYWQAQRREAKF